MPQTAELSELIEKLERLRKQLAERGELSPLIPLIDAAIAALRKIPFDEVAVEAALNAFAYGAAAVGAVAPSSYCTDICWANFRRDIARGWDKRLAGSIFFACMAWCASESSTTVRPPETPSPLPVPWPGPGPAPPIIYTPPAAGLGRCHVTVTLLRVTHSGGDEGNDWRVETCVQGRLEKFRQRQIKNNATEAYGQVVFQGDVGNCGGSITLDLVCTATEVDTPDPNESGSAPHQETIICGTQKIVSIPVTVESAVMTFVLSIESHC